MGSGPKPPDPNKQAEAQNSENAYAAFTNSVMGNANQVNPYGTTTSSISGYVPYTDPRTGRVSQIPQWTQNTQLSPEQQAIFNEENKGKLAFGQMANSQLGRVNEQLSTPIDYSKMASWRSYGNEPGLVKPDEAYRRKIEDNMAQSYQRAMTPQYAAEDAQNAARGMGAPGSKYGYQTSLGRYDAADEAARQRYNQSGTEARSAAEGENKVSQQDFLNKNTIVDQNNAMRQGQISEEQGKRTNILNELLAMFGMGQATVPNAPSWQGGQVNPFDIAGAQNQQYAAQSQQYSDKMKGIFGLGGNLLSMVNPLAKIGLG